jgi:hypothetical protein
VGQGEVFGPARRGARAREGADPATAHGRGDSAGARERRHHRWAHSSGRADEGGGKRRRGSTARVNRPSAGRKPGRRWARRRFATGVPVLGPRGGGLARAGAGDPTGRLDLARGGWEGAVREEVTELRGGDRRRWSSGEGLGRGSGASSSRYCEEAARLT